MLLTGEVTRLVNIGIGSNNHIIHTSSTNKVALSAYDDKRYIMGNGIDTLPFGHYQLELEQFYLQMENSPNGGKVEVAQALIFTWTL